MTPTKPNPFAHLMVKAMQANAAKMTPVEPQAAPASPAVQAEVSAPVESAPKVNPFLSAASSLDGEVEEERVIDSEDLSSVYELARLNTDDINAEPQDKREFKNEVVAAEKMRKAMILDNAQDVRALCDNIDMQLDSIQSLQGPALFDIRNYIQTLMITLKEHPEFDSIVLDADVRNLFRFLRATRQEALAMRDFKTDKKVTREVNKENKQRKIGVNPSKMEAAFNAVMFGGGKK